MLIFFHHLEIALVTLTCLKLVYFIRTPEVFDSFKACIKVCHVLDETKRRVLLRQINVFHYH